MSLDKIYSLLDLFQYVAVVRVSDDKGAGGTWNPTFLQNGNLSEAAYYIVLWKISLSEFGPLPFCSRRKPWLSVLLDRAAF